MVECSNSGIRHDRLQQIKIMEKAYLKELDALAKLMEEVEQTPYTNFAKVLVLTTMNMRYEKIAFNKKIKTHPYRAFWPNGKYLKPFRNDFLKFHQRQLFPTCYYPTGEIYTFWFSTLKKTGNLYGSKIFPFYLKNHISMDINTKLDFFLTEMMLKSRKISK